MNWQDLYDTFLFTLPALTLAAGLACAGGVLGVFVLLRRQALAALAMPQAVAVGVAIGLRLGWPTLPPALLAVTLSVLLVASTRSPADADALLAACFVGALCLSVLVVANAGQHLAEVQNRFVGIDVAVSESEAYWGAPVLAALGLVAASFWRRWHLVAAAPAVAELAGLHPRRWDFLFLALLAAVVLLGANSLGAVMVLALLFLPAATVLPFAGRLPGALAAAVAAGLLFLAAGFALSVGMEWPLSQSVGGVGFVALVVSRSVAFRR